MKLPIAHRGGIAACMNADVASRVRRQLAERVVSENPMPASYHLYGSAIGELARWGNGHEFTPLNA